MYTPESAEKTAHREAGPDGRATAPLAGLQASPRMVAQRQRQQALDNSPRQVAQRQQAPQGLVLQAKLFEGRTEIEREEGKAVSPVVEGLLAAETEYVLRSDHALTDEVVHVLDRSKKYLLGERHDASDWAARTAHWDVDTMREAEKDFPERAAVPGDEAAARRDQPLESIHAYGLASVLSWRAAYNAWLKEWLEWQKARNQAPDDEEDPALARELEELVAEVGGAEEAPAEGGGPGAAPLVSDDDEDEDDEVGEDVYSTGNTLMLTAHSYEALGRETEQLQFVYARYEAFLGAGGRLGGQLAGQTEEEAAKTRANLTNLSKFLNTKVMAQIAGIQGAATDEVREANLTLLTTGTAWVGTVLGASATVFARAADSANLASIVTRAKGDTPLETGEALGLTTTDREAAMIRNVNAARAPVLVKIGNDHIGRVSEGVPHSIPVSKDADFDALTRRPAAE